MPKDVAVHFLTSGDGYSYSLAFVNRKTNAKDLIWYTSSDKRGAVSCLLPPSDKKWDTKPTIVRKDYVDDSIWKQSTYVFSISETDYKLYCEWVLKWVSLQDKYTLFEGGSTSRIFMNETLKYFSSKYQTLSLLDQEVTTLQIKYSSKIELSLVEQQEALNWLHTLSMLDSEYRVKDFIDYVNESKTMYYKETLSGIDKYWLLKDVNITNKVEKLSSVKQDMQVSVQTSTKNIEQPKVNEQPIQQPQQPQVEQVVASTSPPVVPITPLKPRSQTMAIIVVVLIVLVIFVLIWIGIYIYLEQPSKTSMYTDVLQTGANPPIL